MKNLAKYFMFTALSCLFWSDVVLADYPYAGSCPAPNVYVSDIWGFYKCECTSYVAWKLNTFTEHTNPLFSNSYQDEHWGNAYNWKSNVDDETYAHFSRNPEYMSTSDSAYPYKMYGSEGVFDVRYAIAWWNSSSSLPVGHVAFIENISWNSDGTVNHITVSEYNFNTSHGPGTRTLYPGNSDYPSYNNNGGFLYFITDSFLECDLMESCAGSAGGGGSGGGPLELPDFIIPNIWLENQSGKTKTVFLPGEKITMKAKVKNVGTDSPTSIEAKFYLSNGEQVDLDKVPKETVNIDSDELEGGETHTAAEELFAPSTSGTYNIVACADTDEEVTEEHERNNCSDEAVFRVDNFAWLVPIVKGLLK